jgi:hypothetical protein
MFGNGFGRSLRPRGMLTGTPPPKTATPAARGAGQNQRHTPRACHLCVATLKWWLQMQPPPPCIEGAGYKSQRLTHITLYCY